MAIFAGKPGLAGYAGAVELTMMAVVVTTGAIRRAKLQSNCHHQQTKPNFLQADDLPVAQPTVSKH